MRDLKQKHLLYDRVKIWKREQDPCLITYEEYETKTVQELVDIREDLEKQIIEEQQIDGNISHILERKRDVCNYVLSEKLNMVNRDHVRYMIDRYHDTFNELEQQIKELRKKFDKHNHESIFGTYTSKPRY